MVTAWSSPTPFAHGWVTFVITDDNMGLDWRSEPLIPRH